LLTISGISEKDLEFVKRTLLKKIDLIDIETIRKTTWEKALELTKHVDAFDAPFVALSLELASPLWTGDKKLAKGMQQRGIDWVLDTNTIKRIRNNY